jgi:type III pantothenate kinase
VLLAVDIGNTSISWGIFQNRRLIKRYDLPTKSANCSGQIKKIFAAHNIDSIVICSVVPLATRRIEKDLRKISGQRSQVVGRDIRVPLKNLYRRPKQVGQDRLVNAYAGIKLYGAPLIVVDFGTAITFDVVTAKKEYLGGMILPGLEISLDCLAARAALLPRIELSAPKEFIGRDTKSSMTSGIVYGFAGLTDHLAEKIKIKIGKKARVIGTGGNINLIGRYCRKFDRIDKDLTLKGLNLISSQKNG